MLNRFIRSEVAGLAACAGFALALVGYSAPGHADAFDTVVGKKELKVGWVAHSKLAYRDLQTQAVRGVMVDVLEAITKQMSLPADKTQYIETDWGNFTVGLATEKFDLSIAPTFKTIARASAVSFTRPLFYLGNSALVRKGDKRFDNVKVVTDFDRPDVTVAVIAGEQSEEFVRRNFTRAKVKSIKAADISAAMMEVLSNRADVGFGDAGTVAKFAQAQPATVDIFRANPWNVQAISWAVRTSEPRLLGFLNNAIEVLESNGTLRQILIKPEYNEIPILTINANPTLIAR